MHHAADGEAQGRAGERAQEIYINRRHAYVQLTGIRAGEKEGRQGRGYRAGEG